jgi:hypothetical protein
LETGGRIKNVIGPQATPGLKNLGLVFLEFCFAIRVCSEVLGCLVQEVGTLGDIGSTRSIKNLDKADKLLLGVEKRC